MKQSLSRLGLLRAVDIAEATKRLTDATGQLGSEFPEICLAGVYALANVADTYLGEYRQRVVDILCGYLRTDRSDQLVGGKFKDATVESAIIKVIGEHLKKNREDLQENVQILADSHLWCDCSFDFRGVTFTEPVSWEHASWKENVDFTGSVFCKDAWFKGVSFNGSARFSAASFTGDAWFDGASFTGDVWFNEVSFTGRAGFGGATFAGDAGFAGARFIGGVGFGGARFAGDAWFNGVRFTGAAWFKWSRFAGVARFNGVSFARDAEFNWASFAGNTRFTGASFIERLFPEEITFKHTPETRVLLLADPKEGTAFDAAWNLDSYNHEWTLAKKTERLKDVYKQFCEALQDHPQRAEKLAGIQDTIRKNFPDVDLEFAVLEIETEH